MEPKWLLFDLGGVLAEYAGAQKLQAWMRHPVGEWELKRMWLYSPSVRAFESGCVSPLIFACDIIGELALDVHPDAFLREFPNFVTGFYPGAENLLEELAARYPLALLSNTNQPQWEKLSGPSAACRLFIELFLSFKTGYLKPDAEAFLNVVHTLRCAPGEILFFDDQPDNVRGALDAGMCAERVEGIEGLKEAVERLGVL